MTFLHASSARPSARLLAAGLAALLLSGTLAGCSLWSRGAAKPQPQELGPNVALLGVRQAWSLKTGPQTGARTDLAVQGDLLAVSSSDGGVAVVDVRRGAELWRASAEDAVLTGPGFDGSRLAVGLRDSSVAVFKDGKQLWRQRLGGALYTPPLVAGGRVFVSAADRTITAYDAETGRKLWSQQRPGDPLVLRQPGVLVAAGNTLLAGAGGRLVALNPDNGMLLWDTAVAVARGANDVERLVDLVGRTSRVGNSLCARAFQAAVGCVDLSRAATTWSVSAAGAEGIHGDADTVYATESNGVVLALSRRDGSRLWSLDRYKHRRLTAPLVLGRSVVFGDDSGLVHLVSKEDGAPLNRLSIDGTGIAAAPVVAADTLVVLTRGGNLVAFRPE